MRRSILTGLVLVGLAGFPTKPVAQVVNGGDAGAAPLVDDVRNLPAVQAEVEQLTREGQRLDTEYATVGPRRDALRVRARHEARWLYHLLQGDAFAARGGPEMMLDHAARVGRVRRVLHVTLRDLDAVSRRAAALEADKARVTGQLAATQTRKNRIEEARRTMWAMSARMGGAAPGATGPGVTVYGGAPGSGLTVDSFGASAGRLLFPVAGRAEVRRAWREGGAGPGVEISAPAGSAVRAVYPGRVAFADRYGSYGQIVIVDHGDHYYTVSANLGRVSVRVGEELAAGGVIGAVGDETGRGPMLFFEVRHGSDTLDPVPWLGL